MTLKSRPWINVALVITQAFAFALGLGLMASPAAGADTLAPRIQKATMVDADGDDRADRIVLVYNERIRHALDKDGRYPFSLSGPTYGIRQINAAQNTKTLVILIREKTSSDIAARPDVKYQRAGRQPVRDMAGNQARNQTFVSTLPRPCPANSTSDFYANPVVDRSSVPSPTGVSFPAYCAYPTITGALTALDTHGGGGRVIATGAGSGTATFGNETFPMSLPDGVTLTSADDSDLGGGGLDPAKYVVQFKGSATNAVQLVGGKLKGLTLKNRRSTNAPAMVICGTGSSEMRGVTLDGASTLGGEIDNGLLMEEGCTLTGGGLSTLLRVRDFAGTGVVVNEGADLTLGFSKIHNNGGDGLHVQGSADLDLGEIAFNGDDGIFVDHSSPSIFHGVLVRDNIDNGIQVDGGDALFTANKIWNNSRTAGWGAAQLLFREAPPPDGANTVLYWAGSSCVPVYTFGFGFVDSCTDEGPIDPYPGGSCDDNMVQDKSNQIHTYDTSTGPVGSREHTVGLYAADGALVWADNNSWRSGDENQNVDQDASSFVDADTICPPGGILLQDNDTSNEPVT